MFGLGVSEVLVLCVIGLLLFGNRLPGLACALGGTLAAFRSEVKGAEGHRPDAAG
jgi:Sec-independent protein translocase protein TatA